jgi:hypothetical protein
VATVYLFQVDSAKENRPFFEGMRDSSSGSVYFRGLDFNVGPWTPDGVRVDLEVGVSGPHCSIVLIELEAAKSTALRSSRKYLQENSLGICNEFMRYLNRVIKDCDSRADPREPKIATLVEVLIQNVPVTVKTAAALRSSATFLEESPLSDQTSSARSHKAPDHYVSLETSHSYIPAAGRIARKQPTFRGVCKLDPEQSKALRRCILILDAIIRQADQSSATYRNWKVRPPLKRLLRRKGDKPRTLELFILKQGSSGITIDVEALLSELVAIWAECGKQFDPEDVHKLFDDYFPTAMKIKSQDEMHLIFDAANLHLGRFLESRR